MGAFLALILAFTCSSAEARQKTDSLCPHIDLRANLARSASQREFGTCYAFMVKVLFEEELCLEKKKNCGKPVSVVDVTHCSDYSISGGTLQETMACVLKSGVCPEGAAPYESLPYQEGRSKADILKFSAARAKHVSSSEKCVKSRIMPAQNVKVNKIDIERDTIQQRVGELKQLLLSGRSVGLALDFGLENGHAVTVSAMRNNVMSGQCEIWVRDSAAEDDWKPADQYLKNAIQMLWLSTGAAP